MKFTFNRKVRRLAPVYRVMIKVAGAASVRLTKGEIRRLEEAADRADVKIMGADLFRPFVLKEKSRK